MPPPSDLLKRELAAPLWYAFAEGVRGRCAIDMDVFEHGWEKYKFSIENNWANFPDAYPQQGPQEDRHKVPNAGSLACSSRAGRKAVKIVKAVPTVDRIDKDVFDQACHEVEELIVRLGVPGFVCG